MTGPRLLSFPVRYELLDGFTCDFANLPAITVRPQHNRAIDIGR